MSRGICYSRQARRGLVPSTNNRFNYFLSQLSRNQRRQLFISRQYPDLSSRQRQILGSAIQHRIPVQNSQRRHNMSQPIPMNDTEMFEQEDDEQNEGDSSDVDVEGDSSDVDVEDDEHNEADSSDVTGHAEELHLPNSSDPVNRSVLSDPSASSSSDFTTDSSSLSDTSSSSDVIRRVMTDLFIGLVIHILEIAASASSDSSESQGLPEAENSDSSNHIHQQTTSGRWCQM